MPFNKLGRRKNPLLNPSSPPSQAHSGESPQAREEANAGGSQPLPYEGTPY
jgi:hypothetical protein